MAKDFISVQYNRRTIFSSESELMRDNLVKCLMADKCEVSDVNMIGEDQKKRPAKKIRLFEPKAYKFMDGMIILYFPADTIVYVYYE